MVQGPPVAALEALRNSSASIDEHIAILKQLKTDIIGHRQRKELLVRQGAVEPLVRFLAASDREASDAPARGNGWSAEDEARLQSTLILGSLAGSGPAFMQPLLAAAVPDHLLAALHIGQPFRLFVATLQALRAVAQQSRRNSLADNAAQANVINSRSLSVLELILGRQLNVEFTQLFELALDIIIASATTEETCLEILDSGVWIPLLGMFADSIRSQSDWLPFHTNETCTAQRIFPRLLSTIAAIIGDSKYRAQCFIHHPTIRSLVANGLPIPLNQSLPEVPIPPLKPGGFSGGASASFPAFGPLQPHDRNGGQTAHTSRQQASDFTYPHRVCLTLVAMVKLLPGGHCLPVLRLLAIVNNAIHDSQIHVPQTMDQQQRSAQRDKYVAMCAVPVAIRLLQTACEKNGVDDMTVAEREARRQLKVDSCEVLARLIRSSKDLQVAAVEAGAIKRICPVLKKSFDTVVPKKPMWSSKSADAGDETSNPPANKLGSPGLPPEIEHAMQCRAAALEAVAALANKEDVHRQAIVQAGVVSCIIDSLKPLPASEIERLAKSSGNMTTDTGNTTQVILAACHAAQSMSRSVSLLRTSLIDAGIAKPIFDLLKHPALAVRVAATEVCCNLVLEFSPMREDLLAAGAIKTLTEHARQSEMDLRLTSLWALKHLVLSATREIKIQTLDELGVGWLVAAVHGQQRSEMQDATGGVVLSASGGLSAPNAAGERVDLLNPSSMDVDDPRPGDVEDEDGEVLYDETAMTHYRASHMRSTLNQPSAKKMNFDIKRYLETMRDMEQNSARRAQRDDIAVQEQGLDFIRNMLNGDDCAYMLEHLLNQVGMTQLFAMLTEKLAPLNSQQSSTRNSNGNTTRTIYCPNELILSTIHVITHIANGSPQQKQLLIAQKPLLSAWLPHFHHPDPRVRCISVWAVNSLTWIEDEHDRPAAQQRARELRNVGITGAVEGLRGDSDMDVRERVRVAVRQIDALG